jgi:hypothetical protein
MAPLACTRSSLANWLAATSKTALPRSVDLARLPQTPIASENEVRHLLESSRLWGKGLGWVDLHLLAAAIVSGWGLFTADRALMRAASAIGIAALG